MDGNPLKSIDGLGLLTEIFVWRGAGYGASAFGHFSVAVNNISYSWGPSGMYISSLASYMLKQMKFRSGLGAHLMISQTNEKKFEKYLKNYGKNNTYWFPGNVCTDPTNKGLKRLGYRFNTQIVPFSLRTELARVGLAKNGFYIPKN